MKDIAIIGMAGRFPGAKNIEEFRQNLIQGVDSVREPDENRLANTSCDLSKAYKPLGFVDDIDQFDHKFFNISKSEAVHMDPHQRLVLQVAYEALENSGYPLCHFDGSETAVFIGDTDQDYYKLATVFDPTLVTGSSSATTAGRISRQFNLRGVATMLDTACSSSLLAVHMGCNEINNEDADMALACGVRFIIQPEEKSGEDVDLGIMSADGKTRSFAEDANGTGAGEAVGAVLLKSLEKAKADGDIIYAVIKGTAANQDAKLSGSLTAPSSQAQAEVIRKAWKRAGIDPLTIDYIETHGSGTKLGDPIEVGGIDQAYAGYEREKNSVKISSVKSNIAHTGGAAGISGMIKAILSLEYGEHYPSLHYNKPNPFIDFASSVTQVQTSFEPWEVENGPRRCGVSSFGLSGTNVHVVLEQAEKSKLESSTTALFAFSAKNDKTLRELDLRFRSYLENKSTLEKLAAAATSTFGRSTLNHKAYFTVSADGQLGETKFQEEDCIPAEKLLMLFSPDSSCTGEQILDLIESDSRIAATVEEANKHIEKLNENSRRFLMHLGIYRALEAKGIQTENLLGIGTGDLVVACILDEMSFEEALQEAHNEEKWEVQDLKKKLRGLIQRESEDGKVLFIEPGFEGCLSKQLANLPFPEKEEYAEVVSLKENEHLPSLLGSIYLSGFPVQASKFVDRQFTKYPLPASIFQPVRCWLKPVSIPGEKTTTKEDLSEDASLQLSVEQAPVNEEAYREIIPENWTATEQKVAAIWIEVLHLDRLSLTDDFFALGGHSLMATRVISRIENTYGIKLVFKDIFTFATVQTLAAGIDELLASGQTSSVSHPMKNAEERDFYPLSQAQKRLWLIHEMSQGENLAYNLPAALHLKGSFDPDTANTILKELVQRHESLRTSFEEKDGSPIQIIHSAVEFELERTTGNWSDLEQIKSDFLRPFDLKNAPLWRVRCVDLGKEEFLLLFDMHHIISDGVSLGMLTQEFLSAYQGEQLPQLEYQYKDFAMWQQEAFENGYMAKQGEFWADVFKQTVPKLNLPYDKKGSNSPAPLGGTFQFEIEAKTVEQIHDLSAKNGGTSFMFMLSCFHILLGKIAEQKDFAIGTPIAGRSQQAMERIVGMFVNSLPLRNSFNDDQAFIDFFKQVSQNSFAAFENQDYPFELIVDELQMEDASLFNTLFVLQNLGKSAVEMKGLHIESVDFSNNTAQFDLTMEVNEDGGRYLVNLYYNAEVFEEASIQIMSEQYQHVLQSALENQEIKISQLSLEQTAESTSSAPDFDFNF